MAKARRMSREIARSGQLPAGYDGAMCPWSIRAAALAESRAIASVDRRHPVQVVTAWELDTTHGARPVARGAAAWGPRHALVEGYAGSSNHR